VNIAPFALWLVQKPSFVELDVLEFGAHHAADDDLHLLRDTEKPMHRRKSGERTELRRVFCTRGAGLAMLLVACEQGERLDWWRSGVFNALFAGGAFFLMCALVRRLRGPESSGGAALSAEVEHPAAGKPCSSGSASPFARPSFWSPRRWPSAGSNRNRLGPAIIWSAVPLIPLAFTAALLLLRKFDPPSPPRHRPCLYCLCLPG